MRLEPLLAWEYASRLSLYDWASEYLAHYLTAPPSQMHVWLVRELGRLHDERGRKFAIIAPRGSAKTTWVSKIYPLYCALRELEPYILLISNTAAQAEKNLAAIKRELEENKALARDFPMATGRGPVWNQSQVETRNRVCIEAVGMGQKIRGRTFGSHRPTLIVIDDLEHDESVESPLRRQKALNWLHRAVVPAGTEQTNIFVLGTALHRDDTLHALRRTPGWVSRTFSAILQEPARQDLWRDWESLFKNSNDDASEQTAGRFYEAHQTEMHDGAELLWPEREPLYDLMSLRATIGEAAFQAEKQGRPMSSRLAEWPDDCFGPSIWFDRWPELRARVIALDPSKGKTDVSDYSAFVMLGLGVDGLLYVDADLARRDATKIVEDGLQLTQRFRPDGFAIETNQYQELLKDEMDRLSRKRGLLIPTYGLNNSANKRTRIRRLTPFIRTERFRFKSSSDGTRLLVDQLREFPSSRYDDGPDALEMAVRLLSRLQHDAADAAANHMFRELVTT